MRGFRVNLTDTEIHSDPVHRKGAQITPAIRRLLQGCALDSNPTLL
jgi:hypothetical protein